MRHASLTKLSTAILSLGLIFSPMALSAIPADKFNLSHWKITLPLDANGDGKVDEVDVSRIKKFQHSDFFYLDSENENMVFVAPNKAQTTGGSSNTRSELRQMLRGSNTSIGTKDRKNNFAIKANMRAKKFGSIGGQLQARLKVDHVAVNAGHPDKKPAYSVVVGQIHAGKDQGIIEKDKGFGWGNEPIKIYYKKLPNHDKGSVFWTYERNLPKDDPNRTDIAFPVWGNTWDNLADPGEAGIALGEYFTYTILVYENMMYVKFVAQDHDSVVYKVDLSNNVDPYGKVDPLDHPQGYSQDWFYFKAGAYNQCSTKNSEHYWYTACPGTGDWKVDKKNGDYTQVSFAKLEMKKIKK
ncbi:polysaccharide lyase family 7 protein [Thalassomonas sp. M1454]|uniref:polysaccharide lyase family 7 protein n=1 Tax=Thalassomonas sp. M1454 TaxID=2594477 RepID=UPI00117E3E69|nr:polysaccharide lyase family 7 protein [Thalassomonas sp. M1454]TRX54502.1 polysaccharide lyase family 7 protein [Thalassomonas sp. M1454]